MAEDETPRRIAQAARARMSLTGEKYTTALRAIKNGECLCGHPERDDVEHGQNRKIHCGFQSVERPC